MIETVVTAPLLQGSVPVLVRVVSAVVAVVVVVVVVSAALCFTRISLKIR